MLTGHVGMSRNENRVLAGHRVLAGRMEFPHHQGDSLERRTPPCNQLTQGVLIGHIGMSRDEGFPHHQGESHEGKTSNVAG